MRRLFFLTGFLLVPRLPAAAESVLDQAVSSEMSRAMEALKEPGYPTPYDIRLTAVDEYHQWAECAMGGTAYSGVWRDRLLTPDVRVGSYALDNHQDPSASVSVGSAVSLDDDLFSLEHSLWLILDGGYKSALADFLRKEALRAREGRREYDTDDLSREAPVVHQTPFVFTPWDRAAIQSQCRQISAAFRKNPALNEALAMIQRNTLRSRLYGSDGSRVDVVRDLARVTLSASLISKDGMPLSVARRFVILNPSSALPLGEFKNAADQMIGDLNALKEAPSTSPFNAPALIDPSIASAIVLSLGIDLSGEAQRNPAGAQIFRGKIGQDVFSSALSLEDDPTRSSFDGVSLVGHYDYDDEGIAARKVLLVKRGILKGFLLSRYPVVGFMHSNGHGRAGAGFMPRGLPGNLFLSSSHAVSPRKLLKLLMRRCRKEKKPFGLWVLRLKDFVSENGASDQPSLRIVPELVYLVDSRTGRLTLVRGLDIVGTPLDFLNRVLRAGTDLEVSDHVYDQDQVPISVVAPSLLLSEVELQRSKEAPVKPPILPPPAVR